jgi:uncharacterized protein (DUF1778 family)
MPQRTNGTSNAGEERLAERRVFRLDGKTWDAFVAALNAPPRRHGRLERLFREPSVFKDIRAATGQKQ